MRAALTGADGKVVMPDAGDIVARPIQQPCPPIYAASRSPEGKASIAQHCDVWFAEYKPGYRNFESNIARIAADLRVMDGIAAQYGRKLRYAINPQVICCDTQEEAEQLADAAERNAGPRDRMVNALGAGLVGTPQIDRRTPAPLRSDRPRLHADALHAHARGRGDIRHQGHSAAARVARTGGRRLATLCACRLVPTDWAAPDLDPDPDRCLAPD